MENKPKNHWSIKNLMKKVKSTEILIKRKSITKRKRHPLSVKETNIPYEMIPNKSKANSFIEEESNSYKDKENINSSIKIETPKRKIIVLTPNAYCEIKGSPEYKRYQCVRKIDFI